MAELSEGRLTEKEFKSSVLGGREGDKFCFRRLIGIKTTYITKSMEMRNEKVKYIARDERKFSMDGIDSCVNIKTLIVHNSNAKQMTVYSITAQSVAIRSLVDAQTNGGVINVKVP